MKYIISALDNLLTQISIGGFVLAAFFIPNIAFGSDLNQNNIEDSTEETVIVSSNGSLLAGEHYFNNLIVESGATLSLVSDPQLEESSQRVIINASSVVVRPGGVISADGTGFTTTIIGPGTPDAISRAGASHGGISSDGIRSWYGSAVWPRTLGSAGKYKGGGGAIEIETSHIAIDGTISARGTASASGGSILIIAEQITGGGLVTAAGGHFYASSHIYGPGAGGRVAFHSIDNYFSGVVDVAGGVFAASGGTPTRYAPQGTAAFFDTDTSSVVTGSYFRFQANDNPHDYHTVRIGGGADLSDATTVMSDTVEIPTGQLTLATDSELSTSDLVLSGPGVLLMNGGVINPAKTIRLFDTSRISATPLNKISLKADTINVASGASLSVTNTGYQSEGPGSPTLINTRAGASYGGLGHGALATSTYGDPNQPVDFGSGSRASKSRGGGALMIETDDLIINGVVQASGELSGSGGSILINTGTLSGSGIIEANGGSFAVTSVYYGAGGGGRVAVYFQSSSTWNGVVQALGGRNVSSAGTPTTYAQKGTVVIDKIKTGASSILFLPGIMGSRLYEESSECADESGEKQRWFSTDECAQLRLRTDFTGQSLNTLYTKPSESAVIDNVLLVSPLYGDFLERLAYEKEDETIADYRAVPYDWRLRLEDILKTREENGKIVFDQSSSYQQSYVYKSLEELVSSSKSGKVTIVAHSNGGLLAKALLAEMEINNDPLLDKVDNLILVAVPQVGTPDAVVSILHGAEIARGFLIKGEVSRQIVNTAPFSHHLLPSEQYFSPEGSSVQTPVIKIEPGSVTDVWRTQFGSEITTHQGLSDFLSKDSGRIKPATDDLLHPEVVDNFLLDYADVAHSVQSSFVPPPTMKVSQVAGTGVGTPSSITYFTDKECLSRSIFSFFRCTEYRDKLGYRAVFASHGDGTVVLPSALAMSETDQVERVWVDLDRYNKSRLFSLVHRNILEVPDIQDFVFNTVEATTTRHYNYLSTTTVESVAEDRLVFQLHSPLDMWVTTGNGLVSSSTTEVAGALYERLGELQYIEIPASEDNVKVHLLGQKTGSFTLDIEHWQGDLLEERIDYVAVPTATGTKVTSEIKIILSDSVLELDLEGNGTTDADMTSEGGLVEKSAASYPVLITTIEQLSLKKSLKQFLITSIKSAEYYSSKTPTSPLYIKLEDVLLTAATDLIKLYVRKGYISVSDSEVLLGMIQILKNKQ